MSHSNAVESTVDDLTRILALPRRPVVNCEKKNGFYDPKTEALIRVMTAKFTRGIRVSCACRPRLIRRLAGDQLSITRIMPSGRPPEPSIIVSLADFLADNKQSQAELETANTVSRLKVGFDAMIPAADGEIGHPCIDTLNAPQSWTLYEIPTTGGGLGFLGVGSGKSLLALLLPLAFRIPADRTTALLAEPGQRQHYLSQYLRIREHFRVPSIVFDDGVTGFTVAGTSPVHFVPYSKLSHKKSTEMLERLRAKLVIDDEAHRVAGRSARERRHTRYLALSGDTILFSMSGTLESKSVKDSFRLSAFALGLGSPLPLDPNVVEAWSASMDPLSQMDKMSTTAKALRRAFGGGEPEASSIAELLMSSPEEKIRKGYRQWRVETPGIISTTASAIDAAIYFSERKGPKIPKVVADALAQVRAGERPDGDVIAENARQIAYTKQVISGFYSYWKFSKDDSDELIQEWYDKRKAYQREARAKQQRGEAHLDSDDLCKHAAMRFYRGRDDKGHPLPVTGTICKVCDGAGEVSCPDCDGPRIYSEFDDDTVDCSTCADEGNIVCKECGGKSQGLYRGKLPVWASEHWPAWRAIKDRVKHENKVKWIGWNLPEARDPATHPGYYLVRDAVAWLKENHGVLWCVSRAFGEKVAELSGLPYHAGGPGGEARLRAEKGDRPVIVSIKAYGGGFDGLQTKFHKQLLAEMPSSNLVIEQVLGRLHRLGQLADAIETEAYLFTGELKDSLRKAIAQAEFNAAMLPNRQKLLMCDMPEGI